MSIDAMFAGMATTPMFGKGKNMAEGKYRVRSKVMKIHNGIKGRSFIFEYEIVESSNLEKHPIGSTASWVLILGGQFQANQFSDMKALSLSLIGVDPKTVKDPAADPVTHALATDSLKAQCDSDFAKANGYEENCFIGLEVDLECVETMTKGAGGKAPHPFTRHNWSPTPEMVEVFKSASAG
jgi:hypothetical protein